MKRTLHVVLILVLLLGLFACAKAQPDWQEQYDLGVRYLSEGNYEEAIIAFTAAIEIAPKRAEAYVGRGDAYVLSGETEDNLTAARADYEKALDLGEESAELYQKAAEVCTALGDTEAAEKLLERGWKVTGDSSLRDALDKLAGVTIPTELVQGSEEWAALEEFLGQLAWLGEDYDCERAANPTGGSEWRQSANFLEHLLMVAGCYCYNDEIYPGEALLIDWGHYDPLGKWEMAYGRASAKKMDWILKHIFNCSNGDIEKMKEPILAGSNEEIYYLDGYYYFYIGGIGGGFWATVTSVERKGMRYEVEYEQFNWYQNENNEGVSTSRCALMSLKEIDGKKYWSLYYDREPNNEEGQDPGESGSGWRQAYLDYIQDNFMTRKGLADQFQLIYIDHDDIPELWFCGSDIATGGLVCTFDGRQVNEVYISEYGDLEYIERRNLFLTSGGHSDVYWNSIYTIQDGQFVELVHGNFGAENNADVQFDETGLPVYVYNWDGQDVSSQEYLGRLTRAFDMSAARNVFDDPSYSYDQILRILSE